MPFEKGHPHYPPKDGKPSGMSRGGVRMRVQLAHYLHEAIDADEIYYWLREVAAGRDPDRRKNSVENPPDWATRKAAMAMILDRRDGRPAQHVHLQQELKAAIGVAAISVTPDRLAALPDEKKSQLRALLRDVVGAPGLPSGTSSGIGLAVGAVIDAASTEGSRQALETAAGQDAEDEEDGEDEP